MHDTAAPRVGRAPAAEGKLAASDPIGNHVGGPAGTFALNVDTLLVPVAPSVAVAVGERSTFQGWSRDANPATTSNFTDAVEVTLPGQIGHPNRRELRQDVRHGTE
ncbi:MAG: hypothetical protein R3F49_24090, partial [Planctomycetota bacterium]